MLLFFLNNHINNNAFKNNFIVHRIKHDKNPQKQMQNGTKGRSHKHQSDYFQMDSRFFIIQQKHSQQVCKDSFVPKLHIKKQTQQREFLHYKVRLVQHSLTIAERSGWTQWSKTFSRGHFH